MGEMRERMLRGELYVADDSEIAAEFGHAQEMLARFNGAEPDAWDRRDALLREMLHHVGEGVVVRPPFYCEYGNIRIGDRTFVNVDAIVLDVAPVTIGTACQIAPRVQILTATIRSIPSRVASAGSTQSPSRSPTTSGSAAASLSVLA
jgi:maltose O-acetyltransferase